MDDFEEIGLRNLPGASLPRPPAFRVEPQPGVPGRSQDDVHTVATQDFVKFALVERRGHEELPTGSGSRTNAARVAASTTVALKVGVLVVDSGIVWRVVGVVVASWSGAGCARVRECSTRSGG